MQSPTNAPQSGVNGQGRVTPSSASLGKASPSLSQEFNSFLADVEDLFKETASLTGADLDQFKARLGTRIATARASLESMGDVIVERAQNTASMTNDYVHERPWSVIGVSAAAAFLVGLLVARRG